MAITPVTAPLPAENADPWITARTLLDNQLKATANAAAALADANQAALATKADGSALTAGLATKIDASQRGANNGVATLDAQGKLLTGQLPALAVTEYLQSSANQAAMLAKVGQQGDWTIRTDLGTVWIITGADPTQLSSWTQLGYPSAPVTTVNGFAGIVVLTAADVGALSLTEFADYVASSLAAFEALETVVASKAAEADLTALQTTVTTLQGTVSTVAGDANNAFQTAQDAAADAAAAQADATQALAGMVVDGVIDHDETPPSPGIYLRRPAAVFEGPFDALAAPYRAHSLRRLLSAYTGPLIKVRRSSDSTTQEIGYNADGTLNTTALLAFVGAGDGFIETFYDQAPNARHLSQATAANQPRIVAAGVLDAVNGKPAMVFDGVSDLLLSPVAGLFAAAAATVAAVLKSNSNAVANATVFAESRTANNNGFWRAIRGSSANWNVQATDDAGVALWASTATGSNLFDLAQHQAIYIESAGLINTWKDGIAAHAAIAATRAGATTPIQTTLGAHSGSSVSSFYNGTIQEVVAWSSALTGSRTQIEDIQSAFWGTP